MARLGIEPCKARSFGDQPELPGCWPARPLILATERPCCARRHKRRIYCVLWLHSVVVLTAHTLILPAATEAKYLESGENETIRIVLRP